MEVARTSPPATWWSSSTPTCASSTRSSPWGCSARCSTIRRSSSSRRFYDRPLQAGRHSAAAAGSPSSSRGLCSTCTGRYWRGSSNLSPGSTPGAVAAGAGPVRLRLRRGVAMLIDVLDLAGLTRWPRSTSAAGGTEQLPTPRWAEMAAQVYLALLSRIERHGLGMLTVDASHELTQFAATGAVVPNTTDVGIERAADGRRRGVPTRAARERPAGLRSGRGRRPRLGGRHQRGLEVRDDALGLVREVAEDRGAGVPRGRRHDGLRMGCGGGSPLPRGAALQSRARSGVAVALRRVAELAGAGASAHVAVTAERVPAGRLRVLRGRGLPPRARGGGGSSGPGRSPGWDPGRVGAFVPGAEPAAFARARSAS